MFYIFLRLLWAQPVQVVSVDHVGALFNMMHKGDTSAKIGLQSVVNRSHLYALGAIEKLKGEILVWDALVLLSANDNGVVRISNDPDVQATLLVYAYVQNWKKLTELSAFSDAATREAKIAALAKEHGLSVDEPFPFLLRGTAERLSWHVIDWKEGMEHSHHNHITSGPHGTKEKVDIDILGFYSTKHTAIWTHHSSNVHMHMKTVDGTLAGHVDELKIQTMSLWQLNP